MTGSSPAGPHPLLAMLLDAAAGRFPPADGEVTVLPPLLDGLEMAVAFTGHAVVATTLGADEVRARGADGYGGAMSPDFLRALAGTGWVGALDATLVAAGRGGGALPLRDDLDDHRRVRHARRLRRQVAVYGDDRGLVTLAAGPAGRREIGIEVLGEHGAGTGRSLLADGLAMVPAGEPVFAAVPPGNARSLRLLLAAGFVPLASEVLARPER